MCQDGLDRDVREVGRIAVAAEDALDEDTHLGAGAFAVVPVDGRVLAELVDQFMGDDAKRSAAHDLNGLLVLGQRVIEGEFVRREAAFLAARMRCLDVLREPDQLLDHLDG